MSNAGDYPILKVNGYSVERLQTAMALSDGFPAKGYAIDKELNRIVLFQYDHDSCVAFPAPLEADQCAKLVFAWLEGATYPSQPDHDGDNEKGWLCHTEAWGHVEPFGYTAFLAVEPHWIQHGK